MSLEDSHRKSCGSQHLDDQPTTTWGVEQIGQYAQARHREIEADERSLAQAYWRLGLALNLARRQFAHGQWTKFLDELGIDKTRAAKARAIQGSFEAERALEGLSVQEAYRRRQRKGRKQPAKNCRRKTADSEQHAGQDQPAGMADWLLDVCDRVDFFLQEIESADAEQAADLLPAVETAVEELTRLRSRIQQRIGTA